METTDYAITRPWGTISTEKSLDGRHYYEGYAVTHFGFVMVYSQSHKDYTSLQFVHEGRMWYRTFQRFYSPRYLVTLADRFAREIVGADA
ncbi:hypothetical protein IAD21_00609 [Abditibacteriota bacterium]|nr:hypothetical protein IAD21_00609 [Abditibacteriota bacterium]